MYASCPKCGHAPLPKDQALPAACPACGIILAKWGARTAALAADDDAGGLPTDAAMARRSRNRRRDDGDDEIDETTWLGYVHGLLVHVPAEVSSINWYARCAGLALAVLWTFVIFAGADVPDGKAGSGMLHNILLVFHEAGHVIFMIFGQFISILGGTLGQLLMPIIILIALLRQRDPFGAALFAWLLGFSVLDMAVYMYDAFDPKLILLGGSTGQESAGHDWQNMFGDLGLIRRSRGIGQFFGVVGRIMMIASLFWAAWLVWKQRARLSDNAMAEDL